MLPRVNIVQQVLDCLEWSNKMDMYVFSAPNSDLTNETPIPLSMLVGSVDIVQQRRRGLFRSSAVTGDGKAASISNLLEGNPLCKSF